VKTKKMPAPKRAGTAEFRRAVRALDRLRNSDSAAIRATYRAIVRVVLEVEKKSTLNLTGRGW